MKEELAVNKSDLNTIEDKMFRLSENLNTVNKNVDNIQGKFEGLSSEFVSLQDEIKNFMTELKKETMLSNAKQSIMMTNSEYNDKFKNRDDVRRRISGLLQSVDINVVKENTIATIGEETIVNNPDYWLSSALVALCFWYLNKKDLANKSLAESLNRDAEMTSLLFCFIHLRANRTKTATKWLKKYLDMQSAYSMDGKITMILNAIVSGVFNEEMTNMCLNRINEWMLDLNASNEYRQKQIDRWVKYFESFKDKESLNYNYKYISNYVLEGNELLNNLYEENYYTKVNNTIYNTMEKVVIEEDNITKKIDKLVNSLIFNYDKEELSLRNEITKNKYIIENNGDINLANIKYEENIEYINTFNDFYTYLTNISINEKINNNIRKFAISLSKDFIIEAYKKVTAPYEYSLLNIKIDDFNGNTSNGSNELELKQNLQNYLSNKYDNSLDKIINIDNIISIILGIICIVLCHKELYLIISIIVILIIYNGFTIYQKLTKINNQKKEIENIKLSKTSILLNVIAEIVDYDIDIKEKEKNNKKFIEYIKTLNYKDYIFKLLNKDKRRIIKRGE